MKAIFSGCFTFICMSFLLIFCVQYPAVFWGIIAVFGTAIVLGVREGIKRSKANKTQPASSGGLRIVANPNEEEEEGDIRHHFGYDGTPHGISSPETIQNESMSFGDDEDEQR